MALTADDPLAVVLPIAGLARSTLCYRQARLDRPDPHAALKAAITAICTDVHGRDGHRRIHHQLVADGWRVTQKTVLKLMRHRGRVCVIRRRR